MPTEVFIDESVRSSYVLCGVSIDSRILKSARVAMRSQLLPGERRVHLTSERVRRRREILDRVGQLEVVAHVFACKAPEKVARPLLLPMVVAQAGPSLARLVFESRAHADRDDQGLLVELQRSGAFPANAVYEHVRPHDEPLLWIADAVAWAWGAGGDWRRRIEPIVAYVERIDP